jgi:hypothetical protein
MGAATHDQIPFQICYPNPWPGGIDPERESSPDAAESE